MAWDQRIGLVGGRETVALIESLVRPRPHHPLPIIVAFGPGRSGKLLLSTGVRRAFDTTVHSIQPDIAAVSDLVLATQMLRSATSTAGYLHKPFSQISDAYAKVSEQFKQE